jgi:hypothetical protein
MRKPISGIYKITNLENGKVYIGSSANIKTRWNTQRVSIRNKHTMPDLKDFSNLSFEVLIEAPIEKLPELESFYIKELRSLDGKYGYNKSKNTAGSRRTGPAKFTFPANLFSDQWTRLSQVAIRISAERGQVVSRDELLREIVEEKLLEYESKAQK